MLGDGMADRPIASLGGRTPLGAANIPNMHKLASVGQTGLVQTVPCGFAPGSDVANLSVLGYPPKDFYSGRNKIALKPDELIVEVLMPKQDSNRYYYRKVGAREALAISRISFAGLINERDSIIKNCAVAFGAISDIIVRRNDIDSMLIGKTVEEAKALKTDYLDAYGRAITPIRGRVSEKYRKDVCMNLLCDFLGHMGI